MLGGESPDFTNERCMLRRERLRFSAQRANLLVQIDGFHETKQDLIRTRPDCPCHSSDFRVYPVKGGPFGGAPFLKGLKGLTLLPNLTLQCGEFCPRGFYLGGKSVSLVE